MTERNFAFPYEMFLFSATRDCSHFSYTVVLLGFRRRIAVRIIELWSEDERL